MTAPSPITSTTSIDESGIASPTAVGSGHRGHKHGVMHRGSSIPKHLVSRILIVMMMMMMNMTVILPLPAIRRRHRQSPLVVPSRLRLLVGLRLLHGFPRDVRVTGLTQQSHLVHEQPVGQAGLVLLAEPSVLMVVHVEEDGQGPGDLAAQEAADQHKEGPAVLVGQSGRREEGGGDKFRADLGF